MSALRVRYQTIEFNNMDIHVRTLRDCQQYADEYGVAEQLGISSASWPLFGVIWPSGKVLAHLMQDYAIEGLRIMEVGCGIALASLVLNYRQADITATDCHPEAEAFLRRNVSLNDGASIPFVRTGWGDEDQRLGRFDLIVGSDLLYEPDHVDLLARFIDAHANRHCKVIIVDPGRGRRTRFNRAMADRGYTLEQQDVGHTTYLSRPFRGSVLHYER